MFGVRESPIGFRHGRQRSWVNQQHKLISKDNGQTFELYDLIADHSEESNIADSSPQIVARMKNELETWLTAVESDAAYDPNTKESKGSQNRR